MLRASLQFDRKDEPLRADVRELGAMIGGLLHEQRGEAFYEAVEHARTLAIGRRNNKEGAGEALQAHLQGLSPDDAISVARAFSLWFQMVNLAERIHRIRRRRDYLREGLGSQPETIARSVEQLLKSGVSHEAVRKLCTDLRVEPVFTAHPTEATRRTILEKHQHIARLLVARMDPSLTPREDSALLARVRAQLTIIWQTIEHPAQRMTVADERENILFYVTHVLYRIVAPFYADMRDAVSEALGMDVPAEELDGLLRFASWVGGDMDGNPNVNADTLRAALHRHRHLIVRRYLEDVEALFWDLSQSRLRVQFDAGMLERLAHYEKMLEKQVAPANSRHKDMLYRRFLRLVHGRLLATEAGSNGAYTSVDDFYADIALVAHSLEANQGQHAGLYSVQRLMRRIRTFGFHLATLDVRQDSQVHRQVIGEALGRDDWLTLPAQERTAVLRGALKDATPMPANASDALLGTVDVFVAIGECQARYGKDAVGPYIISMAQRADDILSVMLLARWGGLGNSDGHLPLDIAPLFETVDDLHAGPAVMDELLSDADYLQHVARRGGRQMIMIGYSDSNKDGGIVASRWALQEGQSALVKTLSAHSVKVVFFHGRGGTVSRGGGKVHQAVLAAPRNSVQGRLRVTEQGEIINAKYGLRGLALRTLEQAASAVLLASAPKSEGPRPEAWQRAMEQLSTVSRDAYRATVYEAPGFADYFRQSTPVDVIERMAIGSRPASRRKGTGVESLRAIPWVFAWTQSRQIFPGWFGVGSALDAVARDQGVAVLEQMSGRWMFFSNMIDDVEMVLAKADMDIAARYAKLARPDLQHFFKLIVQEFELTQSWVLRLKGHQTLLDGDATLKRAIVLRNPYVDPLSLLQVDLLARWRATDRKDDDLLQALLVSVNGIAQGLQNTG